MKKIGLQNNKKYGIIIKVKNNAKFYYCKIIKAGEFSLAWFSSVLIIV